MKQKETLQLIRSRCVELLEQAKLRTPGAWQHGGAGGEFNLDMVYRKPNSYGQAAGFSLSGSMSGITREQAEIDATYIANASVAFEAALESTIAAVDGLLSRGGENWPEAESIIAAWQHLLP